MNDNHIKEIVVNKMSNNGLMVIKHSDGHYTNWILYDKKFYSMSNNIGIAYENLADIIYKQCDADVYIFNNGVVTFVMSDNVIRYSDSDIEYM